MSVQDYIDHALGALPRWFKREDRSFENIKAFAEIFQATEDQIAFWQSQTFITQAVGPVGTTEPDWLNQHAIDRNTERQDGETNAALRDRLRTFPDALHLDAVTDTAQSVVDAEGIVGTVAVLELRANRAFFVQQQEQSGTGGEFSNGASGALFKPDAGFAKLNPKYDGVATHKLVVSSANSAGNDGTFEIEAIEGDFLRFTNGSQVSEVDPSADWQIQKYDSSDNLLDGRQQAYFSRGYRMGARVPTLVIMLPYGCTESTRLSVLEALRQKKAAGVRVIVECRENP